MLDQHEPFDMRIRLESRSGRLRETEAWKHIGNASDALPIDTPADLLGIGLIGDRNRRDRMRVIDEFMGQEGVQQGFDRRVRRGAVEEIGALHAHHVLIRQLIE